MSSPKLRGLDNLDFVELPRGGAVEATKYMKIQMILNRMFKNRKLRPTYIALARKCYHLDKYNIREKHLQIIHSQGLIADDYEIYEDLFMIMRDNIAKLRRK